MSHLIQGTLPLQGKPIIDFSQKFFIKPNIKKITKAHTQANQNLPQQQLINNLCFKLSSRQFKKLDIQNKDQYDNYRKKLKNKRKDTIEHNSQIIEEIFTRDQDRTIQEKERRIRKNHINVLKYLQKMPQKVYLHKKYNNMINQRINTIEQIKEIQKNKQNYRKWRNQTNNSPIKNPNFTKVFIFIIQLYKMTFLLQKIHSERNLNSLNNFQVKQDSLPFKTRQNITIDNKSKQYKALKKNQVQQNSNLLTFLNQGFQNDNKKSNHKTHKYHKSCIPNITLQPINLGSSYAKKIKDKFNTDHSDISQITRQQTRIFQ